MTMLVKTTTMNMRRTMEIIMMKTMALMVSILTTIFGVETNDTLYYLTGERHALFLNLINAPRHMKHQFCFYIHSSTKSRTNKICGRLDSPMEATELQTVPIRLS